MGCRSFTSFRMTKILDPGAAAGMTTRLPRFTRNDDGPGFRIPPSLKLRRASKCGMTDARAGDNRTIPTSGDFRRRRTGCSKYRPVKPCLNTWAKNKTALSGCFVVHGLCACYVCRGCAFFSLYDFKGDVVAYLQIVKSYARQILGVEKEILRLAFARDESESTRSKSFNCSVHMFL